MNSMPGLAYALALALVFSACSADSLGIDEVAFDNTRSPSRATLSWNEFQSTVQLTEDGVYVVEGDILIGSDEQLRAYYDDTYHDTVDKSIIDFTSTGAINRRVGTPRAVIGYCLDDSWGTGIPCDVNGDGSIAPGEVSAPPELPTMTNLQAGMAQWERVANVDFVRRFPATCSGASPQPGDVSFRIQHYCDSATPGVARGPFPDMTPWNAQRVDVPSSGISTINLGAHEIGHSLGFRHEHIHSGDTSSGTFFTEDQNADGIADSDNVDFDELTGFDSSSVMKYSNCAVNQVISGLPVSRLDGIGARKIYGSPPSWMQAITYQLEGI